MRFVYSQVKIIQLYEKDSVHHFKLHQEGNFIMK